MIIRFTVLEMAEKLNVKREAAYAFLQFLIAKGMARQAGKLPKVDKTRGRSQLIYEMNLNDAEFAMVDVFKDLNGLQASVEGIEETQSAEDNEKESVEE